MPTISRMSRNMRHRTVVFLVDSSEVDTVAPASQTNGVARWNPDRYNLYYDSHKEMPMKVMLRRMIPTAATAAALALGFVLALPCTAPSQILVGNQGPAVYG